ncbi:HAD family phosphatase [Candidatus Saccharibacteria bacterium]|nr:HAD family phosphatase [Candidatus Saccharibacteria bacterium]
MSAQLDGSQSAIKWLLVDIGEVLLLKDGDKSFTELLADELGVDVSLAQAINRAHYTTMDVKFISEDAFISALKKDLGYKAPKDIFAYFARAYDKQVRPNIKFLDFLREIRSFGVKTAILSNTIAIYSDIQAKAGISKEGGFDPILYSWEVEMLKPNKEIFEHAVRKLGTKPEDIVFIDDKEEHLRGAQSAGLRTILFDDTDSAIAKICRLNLAQGKEGVDEKER